MKLQVRTEQIKLTPKVCEELDGEFSLLFRQPTQYDLMEVLLIKEPKQVLDFMCGLFVDFENKPDFKDEKGKAIEIEGLKDFLHLSHPIVTSVAMDIVHKFREMQQDFTTLEKK